MFHTAPRFHGVPRLVRDSQSNCPLVDRYFAWRTDNKAVKFCCFIGTSE